MQGNYHSGAVHQPWRYPQFEPPYAVDASPRNENRGGDALFRWTREPSPHSSFTLQLYYNRYRHVDTGVVETRDTYDLDWQHRFAAGARQTVTWGLGYRHTQDELSPNFFLTYDPARRSQPLYSAFVQDDIAFPETRLTLTLGTKLEHHDFVGLEVQPNVRLLWEPAENQTAWAAVSRAIRTPSRYERDSIQNTEFVEDPPGQFTLYHVLGNSQLDAEEVLAYELGYRIKPSERLSLDAAVFYNRYENLIGSGEGAPFLESTPPPQRLVVPWVLQNNGRGYTYGLELLARWSVTDNWSLTASYTGLDMSLQPDDVYLSTGDSPEHQFHLRSYLNITHQLELNAATYYVDDLPNQNAREYVRADLGLVWKPTDTFEVGVWGTNLLDDRHFEFGTYSTPLRTEVPRAFLVRLNWRPGN